jgi:hypothetical protein
MGAAERVVGFRRFPPANGVNQLVELSRKIVDQATGDAPKEASPDSYEGKNLAG